jgi:hypothetical protein
MKKVLLIFALVVITICSCKKYDKILPDPDPIPDSTGFTPDNSWVGNGPFFIKVEGNTLMLLFCNEYVIDPHSPFFEYKIGNGSWSTPIMQATPFAGQNNWGLGTVPTSVVIPEDAIIYVRFGSGPNYANIQTSIFNVGGILCFCIPRVDP